MRVPQGTAAVAVRTYRSSRPRRAAKRRVSAGRTRSMTTGMSAHTTPPHTTTASMLVKPGWCFCHVNSPKQTTTVTTAVMSRAGLPPGRPEAFFPIAQIFAQQAQQFKTRICTSQAGRGPVVAGPRPAWRMPSRRGAPTLWNWGGAEGGRAPLGPVCSLDHVARVSVFIHMIDPRRRSPATQLSGLWS